MADLTGRTILNRFHVEAFVGRGGMADVYKVWDQQRAVFLAMKVLRDDLARDQVFLQRFQSEGEALNSLQHPYIVRSYGLEQDRGIAFILMDFVEGTTLRKDLTTNPKSFSPERILQILSPICSALHYAHQMGLVHCDVKPGNIMIDPTQRVFLTDFGLASMIKDAAKGSTFNAGTPGYMAPEQIRGEHPVPQSDIYALGAILYELLSGGKRAFTGINAQHSGTTTTKVLWEQVNMTPPPLRKENRKVTPEIEAVVTKCMERDPYQRFPTTLHLYEALEKALLPGQAVQTAEVEVEEIDGESATMVPGAPMPAPRTPTPAIKASASRPLQPRAAAKRSFPWAGLLLGILAVLAIGAGIWFFGFNNGQASPLPSATPNGSGTAQQSGTPEQSTPSGPRPTNTLAVLPTASKPQATAVPTFVKIDSESAGRLTELTRVGRGRLNQVVWSPDEKYAAVAGDVGIYRFDGSSFEQLSLFESGGSPVIFGISADGSRISYMLPGTTPAFYSLDVASNKAVQLTVPPGCTAFSPDGTVCSSFINNLVTLYKIGNGEPLTTINSQMPLTRIKISPGGKFAAVSTEMGLAWIYSLPQWTLVVGNLSISPKELEFSPDASLLAARAESPLNVIQLWNTSDGKLAATFSKHTSEVLEIGFLGDGKRAVSFEKNGNIMVWSYPEGKVEQTTPLVNFKITQPYSYKWNGRSVKENTRNENYEALSPTGDTIAVINDGNNVRFWKVANGKLAKAHDFALEFAMALSPDGTLLASCEFFQVSIYKTSDGSPVGKPWTAHNSIVLGARFSPDNKLLATYSNERKIKLWQIADSNLIATMDFPATMTALAISPDLSTVAVAAVGTVKLYNLRDSTVLITLIGNGKAITNLAFNKDGTQIAASQTDAIVAWNVKDGSRAALIAKNSYFLDLSPAGDQVANLSFVSAEGKNYLNFWDMKTSTLVKEFDQRSYDYVQYSPDGSLLAAAGGIRAEKDAASVVDLWAANPPKYLGTLKGVFGDVVEMAFSADGMRFVTVSTDGSIVIWAAQK